MYRLAINSLLVLLLVAGTARLGVADDSIADSSITEQPIAPSVIVYHDTSLKNEPNRCEVEIQPIDLLSLNPDLGQGRSPANKYRLKITVPNSIEIIEVVTQPSPGNNLATKILLDHESDTKESLPQLAKTPSIRGHISGFHPTQKHFGMKNRHFEFDSPQDPTGFSPNPFYQAKYKKSNRRSHSSLIPDASSPAIAITNLPTYKTLPLPITTPSDLPNSLVQARIVGPRSMELGDTSDFEIAITNVSEEPIRDVLVQLQVPDGFNTSQSERKAWMGKARIEDAKTVSWRIAELPAGQVELFEYSLNSQSVGEKTQKVTANSGGKLLGEGQVSSTVTPVFAEDDGFSTFGK